MSHHRGALGAPLQRPQRPLPKPKRLRTKRERNSAKFGPKVPLGGSRQAPAAPSRRLQPPPWRGLLLGSPLCPPKPVVITQRRLCHRGLFNHEVKSLDVRRLLSPGPGGDEPPAAPQIEEGDAGGVPAEGLMDLVASLASLVGSLGAFVGRALVSERHRSLTAALRRHRRDPLDPGVFLAHRAPARPPGTAPAPQGGGDTGDPHPKPSVVSSRSEIPPARGKVRTPRTSGQFGGVGGGGPPCRDPQPASCCPYSECCKKVP